MKNFRIAAAIVICAALLCRLFYNVGLQHVTHGEKAIIYPAEIEPGQFLKCIANNKDTVIFKHTTDTVKTTPVY